MQLLYAAVGFLEINPQYITAVFKKFLNRKRKVHTQNGCIIDYEYLADSRIIFQLESNGIYPTAY
ncbi:hypothetical protein MP478_00025 [Chryseobacterium sp. WG14]|uniref:hypothetical protein n=1 Tax=Chryseobacterium sp. WG14 TaxID=2926909 RepID=UPI00211E00EA|nr:hypothetical protein [Chryseobacterium sp. WG14]MCQ9637767.1 hypothetical protein [Chryseobacterium sp. WG14]